MRILIQILPISGHNCVALWSVDLPEAYILSRLAPSDKIEGLSK